MIGSRQWMNLSQGKLTAKEKLKMIQQVLMPVSIAYAQRFLKAQVSERRIDFSQIKIPDSAVVIEAIEQLEHCGSAAIIQHSWRSYFWAIAIARSKAWHFDDESLIIASLMHDLGLLTPETAQPCHCFSYASALKAEQLCQRHDIAQAKIDQIADAICLHMNGHLDENDQGLSNEVILLQQATACDVVGTGFKNIAPQYAQQVLNKYPRAGFNRAFKSYLKQEAQRHPQSRSALLRQLGLPLMIQNNGFGE
ncbi:cyanamide hydratase family protein with HD domain [Acinetobacter calcoaceticus]|uniref:Cyanamide hydratase family protein with HD domain n=1 Tax=Acinetobacter calcoaceticus TaxID=471 RepID=A0A4R1XV04_ACICA|nr:cyanamide hydratase family protein with HD domain [Acinetobacter calcoaceticus]